MGCIVEFEHGEREGAGVSMKPTPFNQAAEVMADAIRRTDVGLCGEIFCEAGRTPCSCAVDLGNVSLTALLAFLTERGLRVVPVKATEGMQYAATKRKRGPDGDLYGTIYTAMIAVAADPFEEPTK